MTEDLTCDCRVPMTHNWMFYRSCMRVPMCWVCKHMEWSIIKIVGLSHSEIASNMGWNSECIHDMIASMKPMRHANHIHAFTVCYMKHKMVLVLCTQELLARQTCVEDSSPFERKREVLSFMTWIPSSKNICCFENHIQKGELQSIELSIFRRRCLPFQ